MPDNKLSKKKKEKYSNEYRTVSTGTVSSNLSETQYPYLGGGVHFLVYSHELKLFA